MNVVLSHFVRNLFYYLVVYHMNPEYAMKNRRLLSVFFLCILMAVTVLSPFAAAAETEEESAPVTMPEIDIPAKASLLIDPDTEEILHQDNIHERLYPASLTKIMSTLLVLEAVDSGKLSMDQEITATASALDPVPDNASTADLKVGETLTVENLLYCVMVVSANEACNILAEAVSGSIDAFVEAMNAKAQSLGCEDTHFVNTSGLHDDDHYTTAWDMYLITKAAMSHEAFMTIADTAYFTLPATYAADGTQYHGERTLYTTNLLLSPYRGRGYVYSAAHGIKTGTTTPAGNCLISTATKNDRTLLGVILGASTVTDDAGNSDNQSFSGMIDLFNWGFDNFTRKTIITPQSFMGELAVSLSEIDHVVVQPAEEIERLLPKDLDVEDLTLTEFYPNETVEAPISKGDVLGQLTISYGDVEYATVNLLAQDDVAASRLLVFRRDVTEFVSRTEVRIAAIAIVAVLVIILILVKTSGRRRRRYGRGGGYGSYRSNYRGRKRR